VGRLSFMESPEAVRFRLARIELNDAELELDAEVDTAGPARARELGSRVLAARVEFREAWDALKLRVYREVGP
jgi:hypothetical protein